MATARIRLSAQVSQDLVERAAAAIGAGRLVVLPTETVYGIAASPRIQAAVRALRELKGREEKHPFTFHLGQREDLAQIARWPVEPRVGRLVDRYWPGPLTVVLAGSDGQPVGARLPAHDFTRAVITAVGHPLWMTSVNRSGEQPLVEPDAIAAAFPDELELFVDDGRPALGSASTVIRCTGPVFEVLRQGILTTREVLMTAADTILFVCTGNTCRSPMAEAIARQSTAAKLAVPESELLARGLAFRSAGVATMEGMAASPGALAAAAEIGLDLSDHQTTPLDPETAASASRIYCLTQSHRARVLELGGQAELLRRDGADIADPFGANLEAYRSVREEIRTAVKERVEEWV